MRGAVKTWLEVAAAAAIAMSGGVAEAAAISTPKAVGGAELVKLVSPAVAALLTQPAGAAADVFTAAGTADGARPTGTAFAASGNGLFVTSASALEGASPNVGLILSNGVQRNAELVALDAGSDLAVVKVKDAVEDIPYLNFSLASVSIGFSGVILPDEAGAGVGFVYGTVAQDRASGTPDGRRLLAIAQPLDPSAAGAPMVSGAGEVVGVVVGSKAPQGLGILESTLAVPSANAQAIAAQLANRKAVIKGRLGIGIQEVTADIAGSLGLPDGAAGAQVASVVDGSPAAAAKLAAGDVISAVEGATVSSAADLAQLVSDFGSGRTVTIAFYRDRKSYSVEAVLGSVPGAGEPAAPASSGPAPPTPASGATTPSAPQLPAPGQDMSAYMSSFFDMFSSSEPPQ